MSTPRRRLALMIGYLCGFLGVVALCNWLVNPYWAWPLRLFQADHAAPQGEERQWGAYRITSEAPSTLVVGSSRVAWSMRCDPGTDGGLLNAALPGATLAEITRIINLTMRTGALRRIVWGVDFFAFSDSFRGFLDPDTEARLNRDARLLIPETLLSLKALAESREVVERAIVRHWRQMPTPPREIPWPPETIRDELQRMGTDGLNTLSPRLLEAAVLGWLQRYSTQHFSDGELARYRAIIARARAHGIEVIPLVLPHNELELETIRQTGNWALFLRWKGELLRAAGPYWDFSGYNSIAQTPRLFTDVTHFKPAVGHLILRHALSRDCAPCGPEAQDILESGRWIDSESLGATLGEQERARAAWVERNPQRAAMVGNVARQHGIPITDS